MKHALIPPSEVFAWLASNHPELHKKAELSRNWVWLVCDLRGDHNKATRESIKAYGFAFKFKGTHTLPSGAGGNWSHSCEHPISFKRRGGARGSYSPPRPNNNEATPSIPQRADPLANHNRLSETRLEELAAAFA